MDSTSSYTDVSPTLRSWAAEADARGSSLQCGERQPATDRDGPVWPGTGHSPRPLVCALPPFLDACRVLILPSRTLRVPPTHNTKSTQVLKPSTSAKEQ